MRLHDAGRPIRQFIKPTLVLNPETGDMKEVILDPKDGTPLSAENSDSKPPNFMTASGKKGLFPCSICNKVIIYFLCVYLSFSLMLLYTATYNKRENIRGRFGYTSLQWAPFPSSRIENDSHISCQQVPQFN